MITISVTEKKCWEWIRASTLTTRQVCQVCLSRITSLNSHRHHTTRCTRIRLCHLSCLPTISKLSFADTSIDLLESKCWVVNKLKIFVVLIYFLKYRFAIDIVSNGQILLHMNPRFYEQTTVFNSEGVNGWGSEERKRFNSLTPNSNFIITIHSSGGYFHVSVLFNKFFLDFCVFWVKMFFLDWCEWWEIRLSTTYSSWSKSWSSHQQS